MMTHLIPIKQAVPRRNDKKRPEFLFRSSVPLRRTAGFAFG
jgi:hypothetical protein